jgi:hypothetical protein
MTSPIGLFLKSPAGRAALARTTRAAAEENARLGLAVPVEINGVWVARLPDGSIRPLGEDGSSPEKSPGNQGTQPL